MNTKTLLNDRLALLPEILQKDVKRIQAIPIIRTILSVACRITGMGFAVVARVTDSYWVACATNDEIGFGLMPGDELPLDTTICQSIRQMGHPVVIDSVENDPFYCSHQTPEIYGFQSYISVPIYRKGGELFGTLCAIDPEPRKVDCAEIREMFSLFAEIVAHQLDSSAEVHSYDRRPPLAVKTGILLDQFITGFGHDLQKPLRELTGSAELLQGMEVDEDVWRISQIIKNNAFRISASIDNLLDVSPGRFGDDLIISRCMIDHPGLYFSKIINDWQAVWPDRKIETHFNLSFPLFCDIIRIRQLLSNLLGHALQYGSQDTSVQITAEIRGTQFFLSVSNSASAIPTSEKHQVFLPFSADEVKHGHQGAGLKFYVAYEIAKAHQGGIYVESSEASVQFTFFMPALPSQKSS